MTEIASYCPYGQPSDRLWVREKLRRQGGNDAPNGCTYSADLSPVTATSKTMWCGRSVWEWPKLHVLPSIFMPRWASRITLEIVNIRAERVQDISEEDCFAEGIEPIECLDCDDLISIHQNGDTHNEDPVPKYKYLWNTINAKRGYGWDANPWVWVIEFKGIDNG